MKKVVATLGFFILSAGIQASITQASTASEQALSDYAVKAAIASAHSELLSASVNVIDWKVGDSMDYNLQYGSLAKGTMAKSVSKDEGEALWTRQIVKILGQTDVVDLLINKADGKILRMIRNGREEEIPGGEDDQLEIVRQEYTEVRVPAGNFKALYIEAKSKKVEKLEIWLNPRDTAMDGSLKVVTPVQGIQITLALTKFKKAQ